MRRMYSESQIVKLIKENSEGGAYELPVATKDVLGGVKIGEGINVTEDGTITSAGGSVETIFIDPADFVVSTQYSKEGNVSYNWAPGLPQEKKDKYFQHGANTVNINVTEADWPDIYGKGVVQFTSPYKVYLESSCFFDKTKDFGEALNYKPIYKNVDWDNVLQQQMSYTIKFSKYGFNVIEESIAGLTSAEVDEKINAAINGVLEEQL